MLTPDDMTLRDWFAGQTLLTEAAWKHAPDWEIQAMFGKHASGITSQQIAAVRCYAVADAMIEARARRKQTA